ncbi:hypothetical protein PanWU01x14_198510 [Parasponia andersonii]|uniref:Uncharacterized protein n=1 Tax=Parasponia andersonii TaxID=3476 RepID=A0A2P5BYT8_PARAD|nr:hypothetical protein PanWU01x14_198510 [Parasponia andersonii]
MSPNESRSPNGFHIVFFRKSWDIVREDVVAVCLRIFSSSSSVGIFDETHVALIPKSTFVPGCLISDNVIVAYEAIHLLRRKTGVLVLMGNLLEMLDQAGAYTGYASYLLPRFFFAQIVFQDFFIMLLIIQDPLLIIYILQMVA